MASSARILGKSAIIFGVRLGGAGVLFLAQLLISRAWGAQSLGQYLLFVAVLNLLAVALPLGFQVVGSYFSAEYATAGQGRLLRAFVRRAGLHIAGVSALLVVILGVLAISGITDHTSDTIWLAVLYDNRWVLVAGAAALSVTFVCGGLLVGLRQPFLAFGPDTALRPLGILGVVGFGISAGIGAPEAIGFIGMGLVAILWFNAALHVWLTLRAMAPISAGEPVPDSERRRWWRFALPWVVIMVATDFMFDIDLLVLALLLDVEQLAVFGVSVRFFLLAVFGIGAVYAVFLPDFYADDARADRDGFARRVGQANRLALGLAGLSFVGALVLGPLALSLFGPGFAKGYPVLLILFAGLALRPIFGPANLVLSLKDRPHVTLPVAVGGLAGLIGLNFVLVPMFGIVGAALAAVAAMVIWSAGWWFMCRRITGIDVAIWARTRGDRPDRAENVQAVLKD
ncbi:MAG: lipopolysaccharide biosynthesis protein [Alphaproteobacteria bacterium]|nr:lipopolysaccharide biosynthesis protein [Alphaproteobacteria bacterium]